MKIHSSLTIDRILSAAQSDEYIGFCVACGAEAYEVEPDARGYTCEECGAVAVYSAEELMFYVS